MRIPLASRQLMPRWLMAAAAFGVAHARNDEVLVLGGDFVPASPQAPGRQESTTRKVFRDRVDPYWFAGNTLQP